MHFECIVRRQIHWEDLEHLQQDLIRKVHEDPSLFFLLISEPLSTFTFGRNASSEDLIWSKTELDEKAVQCASVSRGGKWTYHGPGQIVIYPIVQLGSIGFGSKEARRFVETFRQSIKQCFESWKLPILSGDNPFGIFLNDKKLVSFGLSFESGISSHGAAVYFSPQEDFFSGIRPCGQSDAEFTSLKEHLSDLNWHSAATSLTNSIKKGFKIS